MCYGTCEYETYSGDCRFSGRHCPDDGACQVEARLERWAEECLAGIHEPAGEADWLDGFCGSVCYELSNPEQYDPELDCQTARPWCAPWRWQRLNTWTESLLDDDERRTGDNLPDLRELGARWAERIADELDA